MKRQTEWKVILCILEIYKKIEETLEYSRTPISLTSLYFAAVLNGGLKACNGFEK